MFQKRESGITKGKVLFKGRVVLKEKSLIEREGSNFKRERREGRTVPKEEMFKRKV